MPCSCSCTGSQCQCAGCACTKLSNIPEPRDSQCAQPHGISPQCVSTPVQCNSPPNTPTLTAQPHGIPPQCVSTKYSSIPPPRVSSQCNPPPNTQIRSRTAPPPVVLRLRPWENVCFCENCMETFKGKTCKLKVCPLCEGKMVMWYA